MVNDSPKLLHVQG